MRPLARILKVHVEALTGLSHVLSADGLNNTLLSQDSVLEIGSHWEMVGWSIHFVGTGWGEEPPITQIQLTGQPAVTSQKFLQHLSLISEPHKSSIRILTSLRERAEKGMDSGALPGLTSQVYH